VVLDDAFAISEARERAYRLYRQRNDACGAARVAIALAEDSLYFRGAAAVARGWHRRESRLLHGVELSPEHGWLWASQADFALRIDHDPEWSIRTTRNLPG
jgi:hypothetical protein